MWSEILETRGLGLYHSPGDSNVGCSLKTIPCRSTEDRHIYFFHSGHNWSCHLNLVIKMWKWQRDYREQRKRTRYGLKDRLSDCRKSLPLILWAGVDPAEQWFSTLANGRNRNWCIVKPPRVSGPCHCLSTALDFEPWFSTVSGAVSAIVSACFMLTDCLMMSASLDKVDLSFGLFRMK